MSQRVNLYHTGKILFIKQKNRAEARKIQKAKINFFYFFLRFLSTIIKIIPKTPPTAFIIISVIVSYSPR